MCGVTMRKFLLAVVCGITAIAAMAQTNETISVADLVGDYNVSYYLPEECNYKGEMTVVKGETDNGIVFNIPWTLDGKECILKITGTLNPSTGNITIADDQLPFAEGYKTTLLRYDEYTVKYFRVEEFTATINGTEIDFGYNRVIDISNREMEFYTLLFGIFMAKKTDNPAIDPNEGWTSLGNATFVDPWVSVPYFLNPDERPYYEVELQQNNANSDLYRLVDPYRGNYPIIVDNMIVDNVSFAEHGYIQFNISDPDHVTFDHVEAGCSNPAWYTSKFYCYNTLSWKAMNSGLTPAEVVAQEGDNIPYTTYKDGVVRIGCKSVKNADGTESTVYDARYGTHWAPLGGHQWENEDGSIADMNGSIIFPGYSGVESIDTDNTNAPEVYYNLQGFPVSNPEKGLFLVRKGDKTVKILK